MFVLAKLTSNFGAEVLCRLSADEQYRATIRIAAKMRSLRTTQYFNAIELDKATLQNVCARNRKAIKIEQNTR